MDPTDLSDSLSNGVQELKGLQYRVQPAMRLDQHAQPGEEGVYEPQGASNLNEGYASRYNPVRMKQSQESMEGLRTANPGNESFGSQAVSQFSGAKTRQSPGMTESPGQQGTSPYGVLGMSNSFSGVGNGSSADTVAQTDPYGASMKRQIQR